MRAERENGLRVFRSRDEALSRMCVEALAIGRPDLAIKALPSIEDPPLLVGTTRTIGAVSDEIAEEVAPAFVDHLFDDCDEGDRNRVLREWEHRAEIELFERIDERIEACLRDRLLART